MTNILRGHPTIYFVQYISEGLLLHFGVSLTMSHGTYYGRPKYDITVATCLLIHVLLSWDAIF
jgi:hypothetical protein